MGSKAPPADSPTATDAAGIAQISTDTTPDPDYYTMTITQAEKAGKPAVIVFATPAFCRTATCGPTLDRVQAVAQPYKPKVNFVHVEPYVLQETSTGLQPVLDKQGNLQVCPRRSRSACRPSPTPSCCDLQGRVAFKFDGIMSEDELRGALEAVTADPWRVRSARERARRPDPGGRGLAAFREGGAADLRERGDPFVQQVALELQRQP